VSTLSETVVRPGIVVWTLGGETIETSYGTNCTALLDPDGVILVDPLIAPVCARMVEAALRVHTAAPVRAVVLTHHHTDHALGSSYFADQGIPVVAHRACRERMAAEHPGLIQRRRENPHTRELFADAESRLPSVTFDDGVTLYVGSLEAEIWHPGWAHTPGDAFVFVPAARVAICGDLLWNGYHYNYEDASLPGIRRGLDALRALDADVFIPGHGAPADAAAIDVNAAYHDGVEAIVREAGDRDAAEVAADLLARFPDHRLDIVVPTAVARVRAQVLQA
jgi:cyclase